MKTNTKSNIVTVFLTDGDKKFELFMKWFQKFDNTDKLTTCDCFNYIDKNKLNTETLDRIRIYFANKKAPQQ